MGGYKILRKEEGSEMMQIIKQTRKEKIKMYRKNCSKKELAKMLVNCNEIIERLLPHPLIVTNTNNKNI